MTAKPKFTEDELQSVLCVLRSCPKDHGQNVPQKANVIVSRSGIIDEDRTQFKTRCIVRELIGRGFPVVSSSRGFWLANSVEEIDKSIASLMGRCIGIQARADDLERCKWSLMGESAQ